MMPKSLPSLQSLRLHIIAFIAVRTVLNTLYRMVYPFLPSLARGLGVDLQTLSLAITARAAAGSLGPLLASIADSRGRKAGILFGLLLFIAGVSLVVFWPVYPAFFLALILTAMGKYTFDPSIQAYLGDRVPYQRRGLAMAATELSWSLSFIVGVPLAGFLMARGGWMAPFPLLLILGLLSFAGLAFLLPPDQAVNRNRSGLASNLRTVFTSPAALAGLSLAMLVSIANEVVNLVFGVWMEDSLGLMLAGLAGASAVIGISEFGGESLVGALSDRLGKARSVGLGLILNSLAALALPILGRSVTGALAGLFLFYITFEFTLVSSIPLMTEILPGARATMMATNVASLSLGRAVGAQLASRLYLLGFPVNAAAAVLFNLLALLALLYLLRRNY